MTVAVSPTRTDIQTALVAFLTAVVPAVQAFEGQENRIPEPTTPDWIVFWPLRQPPLTTTLDAVQFAAFTGSIANNGTVNTLTVTGVTTGTLALGAAVFGAGITPGSLTISAQVSGAAGGIGVYTLAGPLVTIASEAMNASALTKAIEREWVFQVDVHGPASSNNAAIIATAMTGDFAVQNFKATNPLIGPLYAGEPQFAPWQNAEQQWEDRWIIEAHLQANQTVSGLPQDTMGAATVIPVSVDVAYPP